MRRARGFTLIEVMVVIAIIALVMGGVVVAARSLAKTELRASASKMSGAIRFLFDRARATGKHYRMVIDLDNGKYWAEESDDKFYLVREKERTAKAGRGPDDRVDPKKREALHPVGGEGSILMAAAEDDTVLDDRGQIRLGQAKAMFKSFKEATLKPVQLKKSVKIADVYTPKQREPYKEGRAYLYFFPQGFGERAIIHLSDGGDAFYSMTVHPLTGRVVVQSGYTELPRDFDRRDDEGNVSE
jgi:general secretion pathway protein H